MRTKRVAALIQGALGELIRSGIRDPRVTDVGVVSVTGVTVSRDVTTCTVFVSASTDDAAEIDQLLAGLERAAGFLRTELSRRLSLRRTPTLRFVLDPAPLAGRRVEEVLAEIQPETEADEPPG